MLAPQKDTINLAFVLQKCVHRNVLHREKSVLQKQKCSTKVTKSVLQKQKCSTKTGKNVLQNGHNVLQNENVVQKMG